MKERKHELTRRDFLKKSAISALGVMASGVLGGSVIAAAEEQRGTYIPGTYSAEAKGALLMLRASRMSRLMSRRKRRQSAELTGKNWNRLF